MHTNGTQQGTLDPELLKQLEETAVEAARSAGELVESHFEQPHQVIQKGKLPGADIVTDADKSAQELIFKTIRKRFSQHAILGEEDADLSQKATDFLWAVDPIDGTKNFAVGAIEFGVSVGVLYRGVPVAGAIWTLWGGARKSRTVHARQGGGAWMDGVRLKIRDEKDGVPVRDRHAILPGNFHRLYRKDRPLLRNSGDSRVIGSVSWEVVSLVTNAAQYIVTGVCHTWDFGAALVIIKEAGGVNLTTSSDGELVPLDGWRNGGYANDNQTFCRIQGWRGVLVAAGPNIGRFLTDNLHISGRQKPRQLVN